MNRYEYRTMQAPIERLGDASFVRDLNEIGAEGWMLVTAIPRERHGYSHEVHLLFSRASESDATPGAQPSFQRHR